MLTKQTQTLTNPALMICASCSCPPGEDAKTYSTILSPTPSADREKERSVIQMVC